MSFRSIGARLGIAFASLVVCLAVIAAMSWQSNRRIGHALDGASAAWARIESLNLLRAEVLRLQLDVAEFNRSEIAAARTGMMERLERTEAQVRPMDIEPVAATLPPLRTALDGLGEAIATRRATARLSSLEASSSTITSATGCVCANTLASRSSRWRAWL